ncbi:transmembrane channel-like protein 6 isoform X2 [Brachyhypopomus gauderio]|uniref:transmembrane channel-like protein 6 isoform X2 n=1 Tax=Brachyhypopomus gauderio TaxID=698409 RepID=UPI00404365AF
MAHSVSFAVDIHQTELDSESSEDDFVIYQDFPNMDRGFDAVEMALIGGSSDRTVTAHDDGEEAGQRAPFTRNRWSAATTRVLSSMPSRSVGRSGAEVSQHQRPQVSSQTSSGRTLHHPTSEVSQRQNLLRNLKSLTAAERVRRLRNMPLSLHEKCDLRVLACPEKDSEALSAIHLTRCSLLKTLHSGWQGVLSLLVSVHLWQGALKHVSGRFGTGVLSYFVFLRTLLLYNLFLSIIIILFLVVPQVICGSSLSLNMEKFVGFEILTGTGLLTNSLLFYGYYNYTEHNSCQQRNENEPYKAAAYNIRLAYLLIIGTVLTVTCIMLVYSVSKIFGKNFDIFKSHGNLALKVFTSWDFKVSKKTSVKLQAENICVQLKELLCELGSEKPKRNVTSRLQLLANHSVAWAACLGSTVGILNIVYYFYNYKLSPEGVINDSDELQLLGLPFLLCCVNFLLPTVFNMIAYFEGYDSLSLCICVSIIRNVLLKVSTVVALCYHWKKSIDEPQTDCWETFVGQELYRFLIMDNIFAVLYIIFGEFIWRFLSQVVLGRKRKPVFDIARNVLDLIYGQTLVWLGMLFTPLLPAIQIVKLFFLFYLKRASLMENCQAPRKPWRATEMNSIFMSILFFPSFVGAAACIAYTMWSHKPSSTCGPFRNLPNMFSSGREWRKSLEGSSLSWLKWAYNFIDNPLFLFITAGIFILLIYTHIQAADGQRRIILSLQEQIKNECEDKKFLIAKLQALCDEQDNS